jgi:hypothetical protein
MFDFKIVHNNNCCTVISLYFDSYVVQVGVEFFLDILNHHEEIKGSFRLALKEMFIFHIFFITYILSFNHIHTIQLSVAIRWGLSPSPHRLKAQWEDLPCGAEPRIELGPALQQADALLKRIVPREG